jgi:hypothetical protein
MAARTGRPNREPAALLRWAARSRCAVEERVEIPVLTDKTVPVIGVEPDELRWIRMLILLLRHPDPGTPELVRQALLYLTDTAVQRVFSPADDSDPAA